MMFHHKNTIVFGILTLVLCASTALPARAEWNQPSCNPDLVGPTDSSCLVSAPLNVSDASQTKTGPLTVQDTVNAGDLNVSSAYMGSGRVIITTSSGNALAITHNDAVTQALTVSTGSTESGVQVTQSGSGNGLYVLSISGPAVAGQNSSNSNGALYGNNSSTGPAVVGENSSSTNAAMYGVNSSSTAYGGVRGCSSVSGYCTTLGSSTLAAFIQGPGSVGSASSRISTGSALSIYATNSGTRGIYIDTSNDATGLNITAAGTNGIGAQITTTGTSSRALDIDSSGTGIAFSLDTTANNAIGMSVTQSGTNTTGLLVSTSGVGVNVIGTPATGVQTTGTSYGLSSTVSTATGVYGYATSSGTGVIGGSATGRAGYFYSGTTGVNGVLYVQNTSTGEGLSVETGGVTVSTIPNPSGWPATGGKGTQSTSATSYGVTGYSTANTGYGAGVYGRGTNDYGVVAYSDSDYGLYANSQASTYYGGLLCNTGNVNCASLGGATYSGLFSGRVRINASSTANALQVANSNTTPPYGYGVRSATMVGTITLTTPLDGTAIDGQAYNGYGVYGYSQQDIGVYGYGNDGGVYGAPSSSTGYGVYGAATDGYGGHFTSSGNSSTALYVENTNSVFGFTKYGVRVSMADSPNAVGIQSNVEYGTAGRFTSGFGGTALDVSTNTDGTAIDITVDDFDTAIDTNGGFIQNDGAYRGGQFYPNENAGNGVRPNAIPVRINVGDIGFREYAKSMVYDGSQLWVLGYSGMTAATLYRYDVSTGQQLHDSDTSLLSVADMVEVQDAMYVFSSSSDSVFIENMLDGSTTTDTTGSTHTPNCVMHDGDDVWIGSDDAIEEWTNFSGSPTVRKSGTGVINDIIFADGYAWAVDQTNNLVYKIDNASPYTVTQITVGNTPHSLVYDGAHIWVSNYTDNTLTRIDPETNATTTIDVSSLGTGPRHLDFDGANIWIAFVGTDEIGYYNVANQTVSAYSADMTAINTTAIEFDGTQLWVGEATTSALDSGELYKIYTGTGFGSGNPVIKDGLLMYNTSGTVYCIYVDSTGNLQESTTLTNCQ